jgi:cytochrome c553
MKYAGFLLLIPALAVAWVFDASLPQPKSLPLGGDTLPVQYNNKPAEVKIPLYGSSFVGPDGNVDDRMNRIEKALTELQRVQKLDSEKLDFIVAAVKKAEAEVPQALPNRTEEDNEQDKLVRETLTVCAKCHHPATADAKGQGYVMFGPKGNYLKNPREMRKQVKRVQSQDPAFVMPPRGGPQITPQQKVTFAAVALAEATAQEHNAAGSPKQSP